MYEKLKQAFGSGSINQDKNGVCRFRITNADVVIKIINMVNGKFRTPKIEALYRAIDNVNKWRDANITKLPLDSSNIDSNAWLAGFADSDAHFSIRLSGNYRTDDSQGRGRVQCVFTINQREIHKKTGESCVPFMQKLADHFQCNLNNKTTMIDYFKEPAKLVVFFLQSDKKHHLVISYFSKYPLMSSKHLNYLCYVKSLNYLGRRLTQEEIYEIRNIKDAMNKKRTEFNWDHLDNFYT